MTTHHPLRTASTALTLLVMCCASATAQTAPNSWPWGSGFERRQAPSTVPQPEPLPHADTAPATTASHDRSQTKTQGSGRSSPGGGRAGSGNHSGGRGR